MRRAATAILVAGAAVLGGCGGSEATTTDSASTPVSPEATVAEGAVRVAMRDFEFVPENVTVEPGQTITWVNEDSAQHDAVAAEGDGPDSELFNQGESYSWTAEKPGTIRYVCTVHPGMDGTITVR
jgi:plastocyanin